MVAWGTSPASHTTRVCVGDVGVLGGGMQFNSAVRPALQGQAPQSPIVQGGRGPELLYTLHTGQEAAMCTDSAPGQGAPVPVDGPALAMTHPTWA